MRHRIKKRDRSKLGKDHAQTKALVKNLAMNVIIYEKIQTTEKRAKVAQPFVEKLITIVKKNQDNKVHGIREIKRLLDHEDSSKKLFEVLLEKYKNLDSGFTRITKIGPRKGDNADMVQLELV